MNFPIVDIGSNTVKLAVYNPEAEDRFKPFIFKSSRLSLIKRRKNGLMDQDAIWTLANTVDQFRMTLLVNGVTEPINAFATASLRGLRNAQKVADCVYSLSGVKIRILSAAEEAHYSFRGVCAAENVTEGLVVDMGGGSTEFLSFTRMIPQNIHSFRFGFVSLMEKYCELGGGGLQNYVNRKLRSLAFVKNNTLPLFFVGGSAKALAEAKKMMYGGGDEIYYGQLYDLMRDLAAADEKLGERLESLIRERRDSLPAVICFFYCAMCVADRPYAKVSSGGAREGFAFELMKENGIISDRASN